MPTEYGSVRADMMTATLILLSNRGISIQMAFAAPADLSFARAPGPRAASLVAVPVDEEAMKGLLQCKTIRQPRWRLGQSDECLCHMP